MRIISGAYKGKIITAPLTLSARPTTDFAKTGLFNMLNFRLKFEKLSVLDLFAGTGNISYEFISRGCTSLVAVDKDINAVKFISDTFKKLNAANAEAVHDDVFMLVDNTKKKYDVIFADPPYDISNHVELIEKIFENKLLSVNGIFILEHQSKKHFTENNYFSEERKYGNATFTFFTNLDAD